MALHRETAPDGSETWTEAPMHGWFGLTYASYLVLPRLALEAMPPDWQRRLIALLDEAEAMGLKTPGDYVVNRRGEGGRLFSDPWKEYRRGDFEEIHGAPLQPLPPFVIHCGDLHYPDPERPAADPVPVAPGKPSP